MSTKDIIFILSLPILFLVIVFAASQACISDPTYVSGVVIETDESTGSIKVKLGELGPRVIVHDLGAHRMNDIKYGDTVRLEFYRRFYKVTEVDKTSEDSEY